MRLHRPLFPIQRTQWLRQGIRGNSFPGISSRSRKAIPIKTATVKLLKKCFLPSG